MTNSNTRQTPDLHALGQAVYARREALRWRAHSIAGVLSLSQQIALELEDDETNRLPWATSGNLYALLQTVEGAARALQRDMTDLIGEDDSELPTMAGGAEDRETAPNPAAGNLNVTLNQEAADALDKIASRHGGLEYRGNVASSLILDHLSEMTEGQEVAA